MFKLFLFAISFSAFLFPQQNLANLNNQLDNNSSISAPWTNFYGQNSELSRQKRLFEPISWTLSTILMLIFWNGFLAPFLQAQLSLKISVIGWFDDEGCVRRMWKNRFRSFCKPSKEEIFVREFIHQINMQIFSNISPETAELIQYEYSRMLQVHEPPKSSANTHHSLSDRESLFLLLFKNRLLPYGLVEIPKSLLSDEDKNSQKLYGRFNAVWSKVPPEEICAKKVKEWMGRRDGKPMPDSVFHTLLRCECVRMQGDWTKADWPVTEETIKNCIELLELKKVFPESEHKENIIDENRYESEDEEFFDCPEPPPELKDGEEKMEIEKIENEIKEEKIEYEIKEEKFENKEFEKIIAEEKKMRKINAENERQRTKRTKLKNILYDFLKNFDEKRQLEFLQRLEQNLLALSGSANMEAVERPPANEPAVQTHSRTSIFLSPASSTDSASCSSQISIFSSRFNSPRGSNLEGEQNLALGEDLEEGKVEEDQCRANFEVYGKNCLIIWKRDMNGGKMHLDMKREEFGIGASESYPRNFIALFETTFDVAKGQIEEKELLPNSPRIWEHVGKTQILIIFRRIACRVYQFAKEEEKEKKKEKSIFFSKMPIYFGFKKKKSGELKMSKEVLNKFGELCAKFYERNLSERTELFAIEGFRELDEKGQQINEEIFKRMELPSRHPEAENEERHSGKGKEQKGKQISPEELALEAKRQKTKSKMRQIGNRLIGRGKRSNNSYYENKIGIKSNGLIRRKRLAIALPLLGFTLSLIFLQIYLRVYKKYDPITWLWMCMKYPRSWCKIPAAIQKEVSFIEKAKEIARQEMELKTVVAIRKLFEMYLPLLSKIKKLEQILMRPSKFLEKYLLKLNVRNQILLDCYFYDWSSKNAREKPENLDKYLVPIIKANKNYCTPFTEFMRKEMIPDELKHILTHCSQIGGNV